MKNKRKTKPDVAAIARQYSRTTRTVLTWLAEAPPGTFDSEAKLDQWLSGRRHQVFKVSAAKSAAPKLPATTPTVVEIGGAAANLRRLERAEVQCFNDLQTALAAGDPLAIRGARKAWLETGSELRRSDLAVELLRRDTGELLPVKELQRAFEMFVYSVRLQLRKYGVQVQADALISGCLPLLANERDAWLAGVLKDGNSWIDISQWPAHLAMSLALYIECAAACRTGTIEHDEDAPSINRIIGRFLDRVKREGIEAPLPHEEYLRRWEQESLARYRREYPEEFGDATN